MPYLRRYEDEYEKYGDHFTDALTYQHNVIQEGVVLCRMDEDPDFDPDKLTKSQKEALNRMLKSEFGDT